MALGNIRQYLVAVLALAFMSVGTALVIRANMGCVPFLCPAYVLSGVHGQPLTFGTLIFCMHVLFVLVQVILLRSGFSRRDLVQLAVSLFFSFFIDMASYVTMPLHWGDSVSGVLARVIQVLLGASLTGCAYSVLVQCGLMLPGDGLVIAFSKVLKTDFRYVRVVCDVFFVMVGVVFCVFYFGSLRFDLIGVGTLLAWLLLWLSVWYVSARVPRLMELLRQYEDGQPGNHYSQDESFPLVITIARTHGSGGHEIGLKVSERLGIKFYDKEMISATAARLGLSADKVSDIDQTYSIRHSGRDGSIFETQSQIIIDAAKESCVIIGRCADYVLKDRPYCLNIFVRCDEDYAVTMIRNKDNLSESQAREVIRLKDNAREKHYNHYTGQKWKDPLHYDLVINTAKIGIESAVDIVCNAVENILKEEE